MPVNPTGMTHNQEVEEGEEIVSPLWLFHLQLDQDTNVPARNYFLLSETDFSTFKQWHE